MIHSSSSGVVTDSQGLIVPRKIGNPYLESRDRKDLHRELLFNQKTGRNVIGHKSELECALQKQKERHFILEQQQQQQENNQGGLEHELAKVIMERAQKLEKSNLQQQESIDPQLNLEYLSARAKLRGAKNNLK